MSQPATTGQDSSTLELDLENIQIQDSDLSTPKDEETIVRDNSFPQDTQNESSRRDANDHETKEKKKPYVNPDRFKTGGTQRVRLVFAGHLTRYSFLCRIN
jgi:hypothetical protein